MAVTVKRKRGVYRMKLDSSLLRKEGLDNNRWRDVLDEQAGWQNWTLDKKTADGSIYLYLRDEATTLKAVMFLGHIARPLKDAGDSLWHFSTYPSQFPAPKRQFKTKRNIHTVRVAVHGERATGRYGRFEGYEPTVEEIRHGVATIIDGEFTIREVPNVLRSSLFLTGIGTTERELRPQAIYEVSTEDRLAQNRLSYTRVDLGGIRIHYSVPRDNDVKEVV